VVIAIGVLGRPNKPSYPIPTAVKEKVLFDITSETFTGLDVLVVGGGDTAAEYCQFLFQQGSRVSLSYRGRELTRPARVNRESVLEMERRGSLRVLWGSNIAALEAADAKVRVRFDEADLGPLGVRPPRLCLRGHDPRELLEVGRDRVRGSFAQIDRGIRHERARALRRGGFDHGKEGGFDYPRFRHSRFRDATDPRGARHLRGGPRKLAGVCGPPDALGPGRRLRNHSIPNRLK